MLTVNSTVMQKLLWYIPETIVKQSKAIIMKRIQPLLPILNAVYCLWKYVMKSVCGRNKFQKESLGFLKERNIQYFHRKNNR